MKNPKYNSRSKTRSWFPITCYRFNTDKHPVVVSTNKCAAIVKLRLSHNEQSMLTGLAGILQVSEREALRIALYEVQRTATTAPIQYRARASQSGTERGHMNRNHMVSFKIPRVERTEVEQWGAAEGLTMAETVRLGIIWLAMEIRADNLYRLTKSPRIRQDVLAKQWSRANQGAEPKLQRLKTAQQEGWERQGEYHQAMLERQWERRGTWLMENGYNPQIINDENGDFDPTFIDACIEAEDVQEDLELRKRGRQEYIDIKAGQMMLDGIDPEEAELVAEVLWETSPEGDGYAVEDDDDMDDDEVWESLLDDRRSMTQEERDAEPNHLDKYL